MPTRRSRSNDLRAMEAYRRIHSTLGERVVMNPDTPVREGRLRERQRRRTGPPPGYLTLGRSTYRGGGRPRPAGPVLTATAVIAVLALIALAVGRLVVGSPSTPNRAAAGRNTAAAGSSTRTTTRSATRAATRPTAHRTRTTATTATTAPPAVLAPRSTTAGGASYVVTTASFTVQVDTTAACWMEVGPTSSGPFSFVGTVPAGQQKAFTGSTRLWVRLGAPANVTVRVDGTPLQLSAPGSAPYNLTISSVAT